jgi:hypothetical protein
MTVRRYNLVVRQGKRVVAIGAWGIISEGGRISADAEAIECLAKELKRLAAGLRARP